MHVALVVSEGEFAFAPELEEVEAAVRATFETVVARVLATPAPVAPLAEDDDADPGDVGDFDADGGGGAEDAAAAVDDTLDDDFRKPLLRLDAANYPALRDARVRIAAATATALEAPRALAEKMRAHAYLVETDIPTYLQEYKARRRCKLTLS